MANYLKKKYLLNDAQLAEIKGKITVEGWSGKPGWQIVQLLNQTRTKNNPEPQRTIPGGKVSLAMLEARSGLTPTNIAAIKANNTGTDFYTALQSADQNDGGIDPAQQSWIDWFAALAAEGVFSPEQNAAAKTAHMIPDPGYKTKVDVPRVIETLLAGTGDGTENSPTLPTAWSDPDNPVDPDVRFMIEGPNITEAMG